jgi:hypothetical protein
LTVKDNSFRARVRLVTGIIAVAAAVLVLPSLGGAEEQEKTSLEDWDKPIGGHFARFLSDWTYPMIGATIGGYMLGDSYEQETGRRIMDALVAAGAGTQTLKTATNDRRPVPHSVNTRGFPSGHAAVAFATAAVVAERDSDLEVPAYTLAGFIGWSRHQTRQHYWHQIIAGAALGYWAGSQAAEGKIHLISHRNSAAPESFCFTGFDRNVEIRKPWVLYETDF